jgi:hypothetical protein
MSVLWKIFFRQRVWRNTKTPNKASRTITGMMHWTLGILRTSQAVFYALAFFWPDGFAIPAPAQVTQTVGQQNEK